MISPEMLRRYVYFSGVDHATLAKLAMLAEKKVVPANTVLFREWERADRMYLILCGQVRIDYTLPNGEVRSVDTLEEGDLLVWSALVDPHRTTGIGTTIEETHLVAFDAQPLRELCEEDPRLGYNLMAQVIRLLSDRLDGARVQLAVTELV